jgi:hypothetical protein
MIKLVILICALTLDHAHCQPETARVVMTGPESESQAACMFRGQAYLADSAIEVHTGEYVKIECRVPAGFRTFASLDPLSVS